MRRGRDSVYAVVGREKLREDIHPCPCSLERCHARCCSHAFAEREEWPTTPVFHRLGEQQHPPRIAGSILGNVPTRVEAFPELFLYAVARTFSRTADDVVPSPQHIAWYIWRTRSCFYCRPTAFKPVHDSVFKVLQNHSFGRSKKW